MTTLTLLHQSHRLFNQLRDCCEEERGRADYSARYVRLWKLASRAFRRCCRRHAAHFG